jgi:hypothetical protein
MSRDDGADDLPEFHHTMTNSRNNPVQLVSFPKAQDPAAKVGMQALHGIGILTCPPEFHLQTPNPPPQPASWKRP